MEEIIQIYKTYGNSDYIGEEVSQIEHALQSALLAEKMYPDDYEFIVACLLHDIGHIIPPSNNDNCVKVETMGNLGIKNHENRGADFLLQNGFSARVAFLVASHVNAKRYLAGKDPTYFSHISLASCKTLSYQGGPMNDEEINEFETQEWFKDAVMVRYIDDKAKIKGCETKTIDDYRKMIEKIIVKNNNN